MDQLGRTTGGPDTPSCDTKIEKRADWLRAIVEAKGQFSPEAVREHRRKLGLSARGAYGELIGVSTQAVYGWEKGRFEPRPEALRRWVKLVRER